VQEASESAIKQYCEQSDTDESTVGSLPDASVVGTVFIQEMRKKDSIHREYFKTLPKQLPKVYAAWPSGWQIVFNHLGLKKKEIHYDLVLVDLIVRMGRHLHPKNPFTKTEARLVVVLMASRRFAGPKMIPALDLANHAFAPTTNCVVECGDESCSLVATRPVSAGEEILWEYKALGNLRLLAAFGFISDANPYTSGVVSFPSDPKLSRISNDKSEACADYFNQGIPFLRNATGKTFLEPAAMQCLLASFDGSESQAFEYLRNACYLNRKKSFQSLEECRSHGDYGKQGTASQGRRANLR